MTQPIVHYSEPEPAAINPWRTVTRWLIVLNVAVFVLDYFIIRRSIALRIEGHEVVAEPVLAFYGHFSVFFALYEHQFWRFFTYQFCHANLNHILLNMMGLLVAGPLVEDRMGRWRYLLFYLLCGAAGPVAHIGLSQIGFLQMNVFTPLVGASASIYGVMVAAARIAPDEMVMLAFPPIDLKLKWFVLILVGLSAAAVVWNWNNSGGHAAHLGGAVVGFALAGVMVRSYEKIRLAR